MLQTRIGILASKSPSVDQQTVLFTFYGQVLGYNDTDGTLHVQEIRGLNGSGELPTITVRIDDCVTMIDPKSVQTGYFVEIRGYWTKQSQVSSISVEPLQSPEVLYNQVYCDAILEKIALFVTKSKRRKRRKLYK